mmetsp:Transcript_11585/g.13321  ORF Transcript_11585/g.13321 Transcript_11585/m.13321 type:complete len:541 (+) Transcript_11585:141-1763(+)
METNKKSNFYKRALLVLVIYALGNRVLKRNPAMNRLLSASVLGYFLYRLGAPTPAKGTKSWKRLPYIGNLLDYPRLRMNPAGVLLQVSRDSKFDSFSLQLPGSIEHPLQIVGLHDERDRHYILKGNFQNFKKNYNETMGTDVVFGEVLGEGIFGIDDEKWRTHRKIAANLFTGKNIGVLFTNIFAQHAEMLRDSLLIFAEEKKAFDIQLLLQSLIFDTFCMIAFGHSPESFNLALQGQKEPFQVAFDEAQKTSSRRFWDPPMLREMKKFFSIGAESEMKDHLQVLNSYVEDMVLQRKKLVESSGYVEKDDILGLYMDHAVRKGRPELLEDVFLRDVIMNFMIAGRDTTSYVTTNIIALLSENRDFESKLVERIQEKMKNGVDSFCQNEMKDFPEADAVFNESLRMYPSVGNMVRFVQENDTLPSGIEVRSGELVLLPNQSVGRNPKYFEDPEAFKPERWLKTTAAGKTTCERIDEFKFPFFHGGYRICLGKDMARQEAKIFMSILFNSLKFSFAKPRKEEFVEGPVIFYRDGVHLYATAR